MRKKKRTRLRPLGPAVDGSGYVLEVCKKGAPEMMICTSPKPGEPGPLGSQLGTFHEVGDGLLEFEPIDGLSKKIEVEDHTRGSKGPAKVNSRAFQDGWARTFGKN